MVDGCAFTLRRDQAFVGPGEFRLNPGRRVDGQVAHVHFVDHQVLRRPRHVILIRPAAPPAVRLVRVDDNRVVHRVSRRPRVRVADLRQAVEPFAIARRAVDVERIVGADIEPQHADLPNPIGRVLPHRVAFARREFLVRGLVNLVLRRVVEAQVGAACAGDKQAVRRAVVLSIQDRAQRFLGFQLVEDLARRNRKPDRTFYKSFHDNYIGFR